MSANVKEEKMDNSSTADWQDTLSNNKQRLEFVRSSKNFSDVTFIVGNEDDLKSIEAHRLILSMSSPVFAALFHGPLASGKREIRLPEEEPQVFEQMLDYIYTERPNLTVDSLVKLCASAKKFALIHLENDCLKYLKKHLKTDNVLNIYADVSDLNAFSILILILKYSTHFSVL